MARGDAAIRSRLKSESLKAVVRQAAVSQEALLLAVIIVLGALLSAFSDAFLTVTNAQRLVSQISMVAITAVGMTVLLTAGEVDLSVGSQQAFIGVLVMQALNATENLGVGLLVAALLGSGIGLINAVLSVGLGISSFIVTIAMFSIIRGMAFFSTNAAVQNRHDLPGFSMIGNGFVFGLPVPLVIAGLVFALFALLLRRSTFGRYVAAVGANQEAARLVGIPVRGVKVAGFVIVGVLSALSATILLSKLNSGQNNAGFGFELQVIAAVLLGGTSLFGGRGSLIGTGLAVLLLGTLNNGVVLLNIDSSWQLVLNGILILSALIFDVRRRSALGEEL